MRNCNIYCEELSHIIGKSNFILYELLQCYDSNILLFCPQEVVQSAVITLN
jgi:hypothetical protein